jgi:hypothetical protein
MSTGSQSYGDVFPSKTQTSKFFTLPPEICHEIYFLAFDIPRSPVTLRSLSNVPGAQRRQHGNHEPIQFEYFVDSPSGLVLHQVQMSQFRICRQIYTEIMDLYFERGTWAVGNASMVVRAPLEIPMSIQSRIRSLAISIEAGRIVWGEGEDERHIACSIEQLGTIAQRLRSLHRLRVLHLYIDLVAFRKHRKPDRLRRDLFRAGNDQAHYDFFANEAISLFVWEGLETRISLGKAELRELNADGLWTDLGYCFGPQNIQWVPRSKDRYRGVMGDIVITGQQRRPWLGDSPPLCKSGSLATITGLTCISNRLPSTLHHVGT